MGKIKIVERKFGEVLLIEPTVFSDERGFFMETYNAKEMAEIGIKDVFLQDNQSHSMGGVVRGLHFQRQPHPTSKLVRCIKGEILDIVVDLRAMSPTFKQWSGFNLSENNKKSLYVPFGFAHGFCVVSAEADVAYKTSEYFYKDYDAGIRWNDPEIGVEWPQKDPIVSSRDSQLPLLREIFKVNGGL